MGGAGFGSQDDDGTWGFKATPDGKVILGNTADDVIQVTGSLDTNGDVIVKKQFARGVASVNLGSGTTSTLDPGTEGAGTLLVTASSITSSTASGIHTCTLADGTIAGQIVTIVMVTTFLAGDDPGTVGLLIIGPETPLNASYGIVTFTGATYGGTPIGSTAVLIWTGSAWAILSTRRGGGAA